MDRLISRWIDKCIKDSDENGARYISSERERQKERERERERVPQTQMYREKEGGSRLKQYFSGKRKLRKGKGLKQRERKVVTYNDTEKEVMKIKVRE